MPEFEFEVVMIFSDDHTHTCYPTACSWSEAVDSAIEDAGWWDKVVADPTLIKKIEVRKM